jgi:hypothetical protein
MSWATVALVMACAAPAAPAASPSGSPAIVRVSADDVARAMAEDRFFSDYGERILVISGRIGDVSVSGTNARISLVTSTPAVVLCETFGEPAVKAGDTIQVRARASDGVRDAAGVLLRSCELSPAQ